MNFNNIDFPNEIINAASDGSLVVFAGAGVSKNPPTSLPGFEELVNEVAKTAGIPFDSNYCREDEYLGDLKRKNIEIHVIIAEMLGKKTLQPNQFHSNIIGLFKTKEDIRIVTTNQDLMFEAVKEQAKEHVPIFTAPALPLGDDFCGIVHLHGSVHEPQHMVMTDSDFGKAYMLQGYATRFVVDMFKKYVVVFVGYSYNDPIVRYLTSSIPSESIKNAFILSCEEDMSRIARTGLKVISFPKGGYDSLCDAIGKIGLYNRRRLFDWETRIAGLSLEVPPEDADIEDEIMDGFTKPGIQNLLAASITNPEWVEWLDDKGVFNSLFNNNSVLSKTDQMWANWLIDNCFYDEITTLIVKHKNVINTHFCAMILLSFEKNDDNHSEDYFRRFIYLFRHRIPPMSTHSLFSILETRKMFDLYFDLFTIMCSHSIVVDTNYSYIYRQTCGSESARFLYRILWNTPKEIQEDVWDEFISKHISAPMDYLLYVTNQIKKICHDLRFITDKKHSDISNNYTNIENNEHSLFSDTDISVLCNILDCCFDMVENESSSTAFTWIKSVIGVENEPILRRVGLRTLRKSDCLPEEKMQIVLDHFEFNEGFEKEQLFLIMADCFSESRFEMQQEVIDKICNSYNINSKLSEEDDKTLYYELFNWLTWIKKHCRCDEIVERIDGILSEIHNKYPYFQEREYPELDFYVDDDSKYNSALVFEAELSKKTPQEAYNYIKEHLKKSSSEYDKTGLIHAITSTCLHESEWTENFIKVLLLRKDWTEEIWGAILLSLKNPLPSFPYFEKAINIIKEIPSDILVKEKADYLLYCIDNNSIREAINEDLREKLIELVVELWENKSDEILVDSIFFNTLNNSTGKLAMVLVKLVLLAETRDLSNTELDRFINQNGNKALDCNEFVCALCFHTTSLYYKDSNWTEKNLFPLFDSKDKDKRLAAWEGFLNGPRRYSPQIANSLLPVFYNNKRHNGFTDDMNRTFTNDYILLFTSIIENPIIEYVNPLIQEGRGKAFADTIGRILKQRRNEWIEDIWDTWLKQYWQNRNNSMPCALSDEEVSSMLSWVISIPDVRTAVDLLVKSNPASIRIIHFIFKLRKDPFIDNNPREAAELLIFMWKHRDETENSDRLFTELINRVLTIGVPREKEDDLRKILLSIT